MTIPDPLGVQIGAREIYDKLGDVAGKVDRLVDQHTDLRAEVAELKADLRSEVAELKADHESRMRALERSSVTREDMDAKGRRTIAILGLILTVASIVVGASVTVIIAIVNQ